MFKYVGIVAAAAVLAGCTQRELNQRVAAGDVAPHTIDVVRGGLLPAQTDLAIRLDTAINLSRAQVGNRFTAIVPGGIVARNGDWIVPAGARVSGRITGVQEANGQSLIQLQAEYLEILGRDYTLDATVIDVSNVLALNPATGRHEPVGRAKVLGTADIRALGQDVHFDARSGAVISLGRAGQELVIPAGTMMLLRTNRNVSLQ